MGIDKTLSMPDLSIKKKCTLNKSLLGLILLLVLINIPSFLRMTLPQHDTLYEFQLFYYFYNDIFLTGEIPRWLTNGYYGIQSEALLIGSLSASHLLSILVGLIFRVKSVIFLYNLALFFEQLILLVGTYLLARCFFKYKTTVLFVSIITICSSVILIQPNFNFRIYVYLPLIIYFITRFFSTANPLYLMISGICLAVSFFGLAPYLVPIEALSIVIIFVVLFCANLKRWRLFLSPSRGTLLISGALFLLFVMATAGYYYYIKGAMDLTDGLSIGRDPVTHMTDIKAFLSYMPTTIGFDKFMGLVNPLPKYVLSDVTLHIGFLSLVFVIYGLLFVRRAIFFAFAATVLLFVLFSLGNRTPIAELLYYYFPMMKYYRHVGYTVGNLKVFLPLMAGFGLDHFLHRFAPATPSPGFAKDGVDKFGAMVALTSEVVISALLLLGSFIYARYIINVSQGMAVVLSAVFLLCLFIILRSSSLHRRVSVFLLACTLFQMLSYQALVSSMFYELTEKFRPISEDTFMVSKYGFQNRRLLQPPEGRPKEVLQSPMLRIQLVNYTLSYNFLQWDPCVSTFRIDLLNSNVTSLLRLKSGGEFRDKDYNLLILPYDTALLQILGCFSPKLKLSSNVFFSDTQEESSDIIRESQDMSSLLVLNGVDEETRAAWLASDRRNTTGDDGTIMVKAFSANELSLKVRVAESAGAWLYYADAWHPGWRAFVNKRLVPIARANIAFKAIKLDGGENDVRFVFDKSPLRRLGILLIVFELFFMTAFFAGTFYILFPCFRRRTGP